MTANFTDSTLSTVLAENLQSKYLPRLGLINYINSLPFVQPIIDEQIKVAAQTVFAEPTELNSQYAHKQLDLGAMSAFSYLQQGNLKLMQGISIASQGQVGSVLFFSKKDIKTNQHLIIAVSSGSASSVNLLQILMLEQGHLRPVFIPCQKPDLSDSKFDAALVIGDQALLVDESWSKQYQRIDLGQWWQESYALPAVFGVFAARNDWYTENSHIFKTINENLVEAAKYGLTEYFDKVLAQAEKTTALPRTRLIKYFKNELDFDLGNQHILSLNKYELLCRKHGLLR